MRGSGGGTRYGIGCTGGKSRILGQVEHLGSFLIGEWEEEQAVRVRWSTGSWPREIYVDIGAIHKTAAHLDSAVNRLPGDAVLSRAAARAQWSPRQFDTIYECTDAISAFCQVRRRRFDCLVHHNTITTVVSLLDMERLTLEKVT